MSFVRIWVHFIWSTKKRVPLLKDEIRSDVFEHLKTNADSKGIYLVEVNGYRDHVHCLVSLKGVQSASGVAQLLKGESSYWINQEKLIEEHFAWQSEFYAVSVGLQEINRVRRYIQNQEQHHQKASFEEEIKDFGKPYSPVNGWSF